MTAPTIGRRQINLDYNSARSLRAEDIPYDAEQYIKDAILALLPKVGVSDAGTLLNTVEWRPDMDDGNQHKATFDATTSVRIFAPVNASVGTTVILQIINGGSASSVEWDDVYRFATAGPTLTNVGTDRFIFTYDGTNWCESGSGLVQATNNFSPEFITTWETTTAGETITLPLREGYSYNMTVDWDDGSSDTITSYNQAEITHTYATAGTHTVTITGLCEAWYFNNTGDKLKFRTVEQWGRVGFTGEGLVAAFYGCSNATSFGDKVTDTTNITSLYRTWYGCSSATSFPDVSALTDVTTLVYTWYLCSSATSFPEVNTLTGVTNLQSTWSQCFSATSLPDVNTLTDVTNISGAWHSCSSATSFPDVSALTGVTSLQFTWYNCSSATSFPDVSALTGVTSLLSTWYGCTACASVPVLPSTSTVLTSADYAFNGIGSQMAGTVVELWDPIKFPNISSYTYAFTGCTGLDNYADIPSDWK